MTPVDYVVCKNIIPDMSCEMIRYNCRQVWSGFIYTMIKFFEGIIMNFSLVHYRCIHSPPTDTAAASCAYHSPHDNEENKWARRTQEKASHASLLAATLGFKGDFLIFILAINNWKMHGRLQQ